MKIGVFQLISRVNPVRKGAVLCAFLLGVGTPAWASISAGGAVSGSVASIEGLKVTVVQERLAGRAQVRAESERMLQVLRGFPKLRGIETTFSHAERKILDQLGQSGSAWSFLLFVETPADAMELKDWILEKQDQQMLPHVAIETLPSLRMVQ